MSSPLPAASPDANDILYRALARLQSYGSPAYVVYTAENDGIRTRIAFRGRDSMLNVVQYPASGELPKAEIYRAFVGPLAYTLQQTVATPQPLVTTAPLATATPSTDLGAALKTIVAVSSHGHVYDVRAATTESIDGKSMYHISLRPRRDEMRNALRELWIDSETYDIRRARYVQPPEFHLFAGVAELTVDFQTVGNYRIAADWIVVYHSPDLPKPGYRILRLEKMKFPPELPDWLFDPQQYEVHRKAGEHDYLSTVFPNDL